MPDRQIIAAATFERCVRARADKVPKVVDAFDQALGSVLKRLVAWTLSAAPPQPPSSSTPYDISRYRNPANAITDSENCPNGNDASMVPITDD
jgi:cholesterol transport system auxiliary component